MTRSWAKIRLKKSRPWFFPIVAWFFPKARHNSQGEAVFPFACTIYAPSGITHHPLVVHEAIHLRQQRFSRFWAVWWWIQYIYSPKFRVEQEIEAYRGQYREYKKTVKDRNYLDRYARILAEDLTGGLYGDVGFKSAEAQRKITAYWS